LGGYYSDVPRDEIRFRLASVILSIAKDDDNLDVAALKEAAIEVMRRGD